MDKVERWLFCCRWSSSQLPMVQCPSSYHSIQAIPDTWESRLWRIE